MGAWPGLRKGMGIEARFGVVAHEMADSRTPRTWDEARAGLWRMRWLMTQQQETAAMDNRL
jgi:hypothetical protein